MTPDVIVRPLATADIREAADWYEGKREGLGSEFVLELDLLFERIGGNPLQFPAIESGLRRALMHRFPYAVYFALDHEVPVVIAVLHQHRRPGRWRSRS